MNWMHHQIHTMPQAAAGVIEATFFEDILKYILETEAPKGLSPSSESLGTIRSNPQPLDRM